MVFKVVLVVKLYNLSIFFSQSQTWIENTRSLYHPAFHTPNLKLSLNNILKATVSTLYDLKSMSVVNVCMVYSSDWNLSYVTNTVRGYVCPSALTWCPWELMTGKWDFSNDVFPGSVTLKLLLLITGKTEMAQVGWTCKCKHIIQSIWRVKFSLIIQYWMYMYDKFSYFFPILWHKKGHNLEITDP